MKNKRLLIRSQDVFEQLKERISLVFSQFWEDTLWDILELDNPAAEGWISEPIRTAEDLKKHLNLDFEDISEMFEANLEDYARDQILTQPDYYLDEIPPLKPTKYMVIPTTDDGIKEIALQKKEIWDTIKKCFEKQIKDEIQKELKENLEFYITLSDGKD